MCWYQAIFLIAGYVLSDVNTRALDLAKGNLIKHDVKKYRLIKSDSFENIDEKFDVIISKSTSGNQENK